MPQNIGNRRLSDASLAKPYGRRVSKIVHVQIAKFGVISCVLPGCVAHPVDWAVVSQIRMWQHNCGNTQPMLLRLRV